MHRLHVQTQPTCSSASSSSSSIFASPRTTPSSSSLIAKICCSDTATSVGSVVAQALVVVSMLVHLLAPIALLMMNSEPEGEHGFEIPVEFHGFPYTFASVFGYKGVAGGYFGNFYVDRPPVAMYHHISEAMVTYIRHPALLHLHLDDSDLGVLECVSRDAEHSLVEGKYPFVYWLSWNPRVHADTGYLIGRTVPIPDFEAMHLPFKSEALELKNARDSSLLSYDERRRGLVVWRGSSTGCPHSNRWEYNQSDRYRFVAAFQQQLSSADIDAALVGGAGTPPPTVSSSSSSALGLDVKFSSVVQDVDVPLEWMGSNLSPKDMMQYKAIVDVDGNANAWSSLRWKLRSGLCVLKVRSSMNYVQWYYPKLEHGVHVWLLDVRDPKRMVAEAIRVASNKTLCEFLARNALAFADSEFVKEQTFKSIRKAVESIETKSFLTQDWRIKGDPYL